MATVDCVDVEVAKLYGAHGRQVDAATLSAYCDVLEGDEVCSDYQLSRAVFKAMQDTGQFPPTAGQLRDLARDEPRDPQAAVERQHRVTHARVPYTPPSLPAPVEESREAALKRFQEAMADTFDDYDPEAAERRRKRKEAIRRMPSEQAAMDRQASYMAVVEQISASESPETKRRIAEAAKLRTKSMDLLRGKLKIVYGERP